MFAALDLGTNNCRLIVAKPDGADYAVEETFSRSVRLGEGLWSHGKIQADAEERTILALKECAERLEKYDIIRKRFVATEACRMAENSDTFLHNVAEATGLKLKIISRQEEARLATMACTSLLDRGYDRALLFDIGGGSTEMVWLNLHSGIYKKGGFWLPEIIAWKSLPKGVVLLAEEFAKNNHTEEFYQHIVRETYAEIKEFYANIRNTDTKNWKSFHLVGTSGTVTTLAALSLGLKKYNRFAVDGIWMHDEMLLDLIKKVRHQGKSLDVAQNFVGMERADLLVPGCAILQAMTEFFPHIKLRVADRGIREGIMMELMIAHLQRKTPQKKKKH
ncbi:MAG: Ppx/GppA phosphatase family protein [Pseudomonadota bacterium]